MKYRATHTVNRNGKRVITKGDVLTEAQVTKKKVKSYVTEVVTGVKRPWTRHEVKVFAALYHQHPGVDSVNRKAIVNDFLDLYDTHTPDGVAMRVNQARGVDSLQDGEGLEGISPYLVLELRALDADRY